MDLFWIVTRVVPAVLLMGCVAYCTFRLLNWLDDKLMGGE